MQRLSMRSKSLDIRTSTLISVAVHAALLGLFLIWHVSASIHLPEFVEVQFQRGGPALQPQPQKESAPVSTEEASTVTEASKVVELPRRKMLETEPEQLRVRPAKKVTPHAKAPLHKPAPAPNPVQSPVLPAEPSAGGKIPLPEVTSEPPITPPPEAAPRGVVQAFEIEGKAAERRILQKILPPYPKGYNREGVVRIRFTILPNGRVGEMIPLLKSDAVLEENAMHALAKWRFNPLPREAPQDTVIGIITFRYKLK